MFSRRLTKIRYLQQLTVDGERLGTASQDVNTVLGATVIHAASIRRPTEILRAVDAYVVALKQLDMNFLIVENVLGEALYAGDHRDSGSLSSLATSVPAEASSRKSKTKSHSAPSDVSPKSVCTHLIDWYTEAIIVGVNTKSGYYHEMRSMGKTSAVVASSKSQQTAPTTNRYEEYMNENGHFEKCCVSLTVLLDLAALIQLLDAKGLRSFDKRFGDLAYYLIAMIRVRH